LTVGNFVSGTVVNPITDARLTMSMSGPALAKRLGLSRQYLNRAEQGTYTSLNPALVRWVSNALNISPGAVSDRYGKFQAATRRETVQKFNPHKLERHESSEPGGTIFERWRTAFCVHPDTVQKYEEGVQKKMPKDIFRALTQVNLIDADWSDEKQSDETGAQRARL
jgi:transcriptional regulator with XRE-family HTH domain